MGVHVCCVGEHMLHLHARTRTDTGPDFDGMSPRTTQSLAPISAHTCPAHSINANLLNETRLLFTLPSDSRSWLSTWTHHHAWAELDILGQCDYILKCARMFVQDSCCIQSTLPPLSLNMETMPRPSSAWTHDGHWALHSSDHSMSTIHPSRFTQVASIEYIEHSTHLANADMLSCVPSSGIMLTGGGGSEWCLRVLFG